MPLLPSCFSIATCYFLFLSLLRTPPRWMMFNLRAWISEQVDILWSFWLFPFFLALIFSRDYASSSEIKPRHPSRGLSYFPLLFLRYLSVAPSYHREFSFLLDFWLCPLLPVDSIFPSRIWSLLTVSSRFSDRVFTLHHLSWFFLISSSRMNTFLFTHQQIVAFVFTIADSPLPFDFFAGRTVA